MAFRVFDGAFPLRIEKAVKEKRHQKQGSQSYALPSPTSVSQNPYAASVYPSLLEKAGKIQEENRLERRKYAFCGC
ncbi:MAG: hypothetical protein NC412_02970 [Roseburia sp.]|nr:hypothetical protein [Roseburia sp.]MCM1278702.1 hypothetical protein [Robinsoniella sp.]